MDRYVQYGKKVFTATALTIVFTSVLWLILPYPLFLQGFMAGAGISLISGWITFVKTRQMVLSLGRMRSSGMFTRMLLTVFAVYLTMRFPGTFSLIGVIPGLLVHQFYSLLLGFRYL
jgi:hypothetical protein